MTGNEGNIVAQGPEFFGDGGNQGGMVAAREIGAADGALEQDIAHKGQLQVTVIKHHMAGGMAGAVKHL